MCIVFELTNAANLILIHINPSNLKKTAPSNGHECVYKPKMTMSFHRRMLLICMGATAAVYRFLKHKSHFDNNCFDGTHSHGICLNFSAYFGNHQALTFKRFHWIWWNFPPTQSNILKSKDIWLRFWVFPTSKQKDAKYKLKMASVLRLCHIKWVKRPKTNSHLTI